MITWGAAGGSRGSLKTPKCLVDFDDFVVLSCGVVNGSSKRNGREGNKGASSGFDVMERDKSVDLMVLVMPGVQWCVLLYAVMVCCDAWCRCSGVQYVVTMLWHEVQCDG